MGSHYDDMDSRTEYPEERLSRQIGYLEERIAKLEKALAKVSKPVHTPTVESKLYLTKRALEDFSDTYQSLQESIVKSGGNFLLNKRVLNMTVSDLLELIGPSNIRFVYRGDRKNG